MRNTDLDDRAPRPRSTAKALPASILPADRGAQSGSHPRRHSKSQLRWELIVKSAIALFNERGFAATSMQDISDHVGLQKGSLYYYVKSKEMLLFEILRDLHHGGEALVAAVNFDTSDPVSELRAFLVQICMYAGRHSDRLGIFARDFHFLEEKQQREIISERYVYRSATERLIQSAIDRKQVSSAIHAASAAQSIIQAAAGIYEWFRTGGSLTIEQVAVQTAQLQVLGLTAYPHPAR